MTAGSPLLGLEQESPAEPGKVCCIVVCCHIRAVFLCGDAERMKCWVSTSEGLLSFLRLFSCLHITACNLATNLSGFQGWRHAHGTRSKLNFPDAVAQKQLQTEILSCRQ